MLRNRLLVLAAFAVTLLGCLSSAPAVWAAEVPQIWSASQSYQGDPQYDPRLEKPVKMWEAGIEVAAVFAEIEKQTGVKVVCTPTDDENARIPMDLFLNKEKPPVLRDVLAQTAWALDCNFSVHGETGQQVYELMHSDAAKGAAARMEAEVRDEMRAAREAPRAIKARLAEFQAALSLSREDLLAQYAGKDDALLLTMLDPTRRAGAQFLCSDAVASLVQKGLDQARDLPMVPGQNLAGLALSRTEDLSDSERQLLSTALNTTIGTSGGHPRWLFGVTSDGQASLFVPDLEKSRAPKDWPHLQLIAPDSAAGLSPDEAADLEALIQGTPYSPEERARRVREIAKQQTIERYAAEEAKAAEERPLTVAMAKLLLATNLDLKAEAPFWQVQEAVAKATGVNVVAEMLYRGEPSFSKVSPDDHTAPRRSSAIPAPPWRPSFSPAPSQARPGDGAGPAPSCPSVPAIRMCGGRPPAARNAGLDGQPGQAVCAAGPGAEETTVHDHRRIASRRAHLDSQADGPERSSDALRGTRDLRRSARTASPPAAARSHRPVAFRCPTDQIPGIAE